MSIFAYHSVSVHMQVEGSETCSIMFGGYIQCQSELQCQSDLCLFSAIYQEIGLLADDIYHHAVFESLAE